MMDADASEADALSRLEAALDRIARNARPGSRPHASVEGPDMSAVAERLDTLIAHLRGALTAEA